MQFSFGSKIYPTLLRLGGTTTVFSIQARAGEAHGHCMRDRCALPSSISPRPAAPTQCSGRSCWLPIPSASKMLQDVRIFVSKMFWTLQQQSGKITSRSRMNHSDCTSNSFTHCCSLITCKNQLKFTGMGGSQKSNFPGV